MMLRGMTSYELSDHAKKIIDICIQRIKENLSSFQFTIQDRVTSVTRDTITVCKQYLGTIDGVLENERKIAQDYWSLTEQEKERNNAN